ncbi:hypothetical protein M885DRAFT_546893 [Pelagophyceae sp. CCMP2097]|nr:hypothetical protein M885DRAFT_546893 [Pelagophyceae sp. CCMP2097]|mmetsp:Transcript_26370/g.94034  ORF Transcript_26370/g.94034 Transcript_26370/m.94034 type:complete len:169 (-) Transcript_26370:54-560(-)
MRKAAAPRARRRLAPLLCCLAALLPSALAEADCPVCHEVIDIIRTTATDLAEHRKKPGAGHVMAAIAHYCDSGRIDTSEAQMCYILDPMKAAASKWLGLGMDSRRLCAKIHKMNGDACALRRQWRAPEKKTTQATTSDEPWNAPSGARPQKPAGQAKAYVGAKGVVYD